MDAENPPSVLRCGLCNKPFDKASTLKRHGYYCQSRRASNAARSRSCISCARQKRRCDNGRPECSTCITKAVECNYPANTPKNTRTKAQHTHEAPTDWHNTVPSLVLDPSSIENGQQAATDSLILDAGLVLPDAEFANLEGVYLNLGDADIDFTNFLNQKDNEDTVPYPSSESSSLIRRSRPPIDQAAQRQRDISASNVSIPQVPTSSPRSLIQRPKMQTGTQRIAKLIFYTLKSYPRMMLRHNTFPPFIHPRLISSDTEINCMEPLNNCISLMHMISSGVSGSRKLFWKNVRQECERLCEVRLELNKWELLAAMQAISIYIIMRLDQGETDDNNCDALLLTTVAVMAKQFSNVLSHTPVLSSQGLETSWKDWIFEESGNRLCVIYQVLNMVVYFEPATMCDPPKNLTLSPLPAKEQLWEAVDEFVWKAESEKGPGVQDIFGLASNGELVKLDEGDIYCSDAGLIHKSLDSRIQSRRTADWEEWCSGMGGFGGLVLLVASLIG